MRQRDFKPRNAEQKISKSQSSTSQNPGCLTHQG
jgi:hypothetical protein